MSKRLIKSYAIVLIAVILLTTVLGAIIYRPSIHSATIEELQEIHGIGEYYSEAIVTYLKSNKTARIEDLDDILYIGEKTIKKLKKRYR